MIINFNNKYNIGDEVVIKQANPPKPNTGWFLNEEGSRVFGTIRYKITDIKVSVKTLEPTYCLDVIGGNWQPEWCHYAFVKEDEIICLSKDFNLFEYLDAIKNVEE